MAKMIKEDECPKGLPGWLATFGDLMSLLLTFFVLMLSFSTMEEIKFNHAMGSVRGALGVFQSSPEMTQPIRVTLPLVRGSIRQSQNIRKAAENLEKTLSEEGLEGDISLSGTASGMVITIQAPVLYDLGLAELRPGIQNVLLRIGEMLRLLPNEIVVQGHTDNQPLSGQGRYPSNWELSYQRAVDVVRFLITETRTNPTRLAAEGYGEYRPIAPNTSEEGRAKNRRVELHILYAGEEDGGLRDIADVFKQYGVRGARESGAPIVNPTRTRRRRSEN
ncbi:MAG: OmpA family protein [bacterium]|nr:OmpA family protein [bacterium]